MVSVTEAKAQLSRLLAEARVIISRAGQDGGRAPTQADPEPRTLGGWEGRVWIADDFDDPLPAVPGRTFVPRDELLAALRSLPPDPGLIADNDEWVDQALPDGATPA